MIGVQAAAAVVIAGLAFAGGFKTAYELAAARYKTLELSYAEASFQAQENAIAEQKRLAGIATAAARREAAAQAKAADLARRRLKEVERHVKNARGCITYGLVRVLDAAVHGTLAERLSLPAGKSDDACAPVTAVALARAISDNYAAANANAGQLDALIEVIRDR